jgi:hypothetical protein
LRADARSGWYHLFDLRVDACSGWYHLFDLRADARIGSYQLICERMHAVVGTICLICEWMHAVVGTICLICERIHAVVGTSEFFPCRCLIKWEFVNGTNVNRTSASNLHESWNQSTSKAGERYQSSFVEPFCDAGNGIICCWYQSSLLRLLLVTVLPVEAAVGTSPPC